MAQVPELKMAYENINVNIRISMKTWKLNELE
jgi:hypothetical protein